MPQKAVTDGKLPEILTIDETAVFLRVRSEKTVYSWIRKRWLTSADGLRLLGGEYRMHLETMRRRLAEGNFMAVRPGGFRTRRPNRPKAAPVHEFSDAGAADRLVDLRESLRDVEVATPEPDFQIN